VSRWLIKNGIPYEEVDLMDEAELLANAIVFGQLENGGLEWDWETMKFEERQD
jgi:hypothetical protein